MKKKWKQHLAAWLATIMIAELAPSPVSMQVLSFAGTNENVSTPSVATSSEVSDWEETDDDIDYISAQEASPSEVIPTVMALDNSANEQPVASGTFNGNTYIIYDISMNWTEAEEFCESKGGHLVTITSSEEQAFIEDLMDENTAKKQYWIGARYLDGGYKWVTGEDFSYSNWDYRQPDRSVNNGLQEEYVQIFNEPNSAYADEGGKRFKWNDIFEDNIFPNELDFFNTCYIGLICEIEENINDYKLKKGKVTGITQNSIIIDGVEYSCQNPKDESYIGTHIIFRSTGNEITYFEILYQKSGTLDNWSNESKRIRLHMGSVTSGLEYYTLSPISYEFEEVLEKAVDKKITVWYSYDEKYAYFINVWKEGPYYIPAEESEQKKILREYFKDWNDAYVNFTEAMKETIGEYSESENSEREAIISAEAKRMQENDRKSGSDYLSFPGNFPATWKNDAYYALATILYDHVCSDPNFDDVKPSGIFAGSTLIRNVLKSMQGVSETYSFGNREINVSIAQMGSRNMGQMTCYNKQSPNVKYNVIICSTQTECAESIKSYYNSLVELEKDSLFNVYSAVYTDILGKPISSYTEDFIKKQVEKYSAKLMNTGIGNLAKNLNTCYNYYKHVSEILSFDPDNPDEVLNKLKDIKFEDTTIESKIVKKAMSKLDKAATTFNDAYTDYLAGDLKEGFFEGILKKIGIACPVNVTIFNADGEIIGYSGEDDLWYSDNIYIKELGDGKEIYQFTDEKITISTECLDYGLVSFCIEEYDETGYPTGRINFYDIPVESSDVISFTTASELLNNDEIIYITNGEKIINADEYISVDQDARVFIEVNEDNTNGTILGNGYYAKGDVVLLIAIPNDGYHFSGWYSKDTLVNTSPSFEFMAQNNLDLSAKFVKEDGESISYELSLVTSNGGTIEGSGFYEAGEIATIRAIADEGYAFKGWYEDGSFVSSDSEYQLLVERNVVLTAVFEKVNSGSGSGNSGGSSSSGSSGGSGGSGGGSSTSSSRSNISIPSYVVSGTWAVTEDGNWTFTDSEGIVYRSMWAAVYNPYANTSIDQSNYDWFYFDANGHMVTGWLEDNGHRYYLNPVSDGTKGRMLTGWQMIDGKWYYLNEISDGTRGALVTDTWVGEFYVNKDGVWE